MAWGDYERQILEVWNRLLDSVAVSEADIQNFLEDHPSMVPGAFGMNGPSGHSPYPAALIAQPKLPGFSDRVPDFMWLASDSGTNYAVMVEIETPQKRWFNRSGAPTADFTQAQNQLRDWRQWFDSPMNKQLFMERFYSTSHNRKAFIPQYVLIIGRRSEFSDSPKLNQKRFSLQNEQEYYMTFDRLMPDRKCHDYITVKNKGDDFIAVSIPPTVKLGPCFAEYWSRVAGKEAAAERSVLLSSERKNFLSSRFSYWDGLGRTPELIRFRNMGDWE